MPRLNSIYVCQQCGFRSSQFLGKCPECGTWNSLVEQVEEVQSAKGKVQSQEQKKAEIVNLADIEKEHFQRISTGIEEFDRVLGSGIVQGSVILVCGDPGIGKSTLLLQLALNLNRGPAIASVGSPAHLLTNASVLRSPVAPSDTVACGDSKARNVRGQPPSALPNNVLYIAGEESAQQIKIRADRVVKGANLAILNETDVDAICGVLENIKPSLVIVDSIQTMETSDLTGVAGSVGQVRECAHRLQKIAKRLHIPIFLVGHVTKDGSIAGPKTLEHLVDVVLSLEGDPASNFRVLRAQKNRFGPVDEVGIFEMEESGMVEVKNPSRLFLQERVDAPGSAITATVSGIRPILVEVQALVTKTFLPMPRRTGLGVDNNKLQVLVAVLMKRLGLPLFDKDIFVSVTGGLRVFEPAADLAICMAIISSLKDKPISPKTLLIGEVGLLGELRPVRGLDRRVKEAKKLGFTKIISPENAKSLHEAVKLSLK